MIALIWLLGRWCLKLTVGGDHLLAQVLLFFTKAGAFVFGSGLAIVPFLHQGVVQQFGIFLPVHLFTIIAAPWFSRNRDNTLLKAFVQGATAAATGAIAGAVVLLAQRAIYDLPTAAIALGSLGVLWRFKVPEPILVAAAGIIGLIVFPLFRS